MRKKGARVGSGVPDVGWRLVKPSGHLPERVVTLINELIVAERLKPGTASRPSASSPSCSG